MMLILYVVHSCVCIYSFFHPVCNRWAVYIFQLNWNVYACMGSDGGPYRSGGPLIHLHTWKRTKMFSENRNIGESLTRAGGLGAVRVVKVLTGSSPCSCSEPPGSHTGWRRGPATPAPPEQTRSAGESWRCWPPPCSRSQTRSVVPRCLAPPGGFTSYWTHWFKPYLTIKLDIKHKLFCSFLTLFTSISYFTFSWKHKSSSVESCKTDVQCHTRRGATSMI